MSTVEDLAAAGPTPRRVPAPTPVPAPPDLTEAGDDALVRAARLGDRHAFEVIVHRYGPAMYRYARRLLHDPGDVQEVVQDAFVAAWHGLQSYQGRSALQTWLFGLTAHKAVDLARKARARPIDDRLLVAVPSDAHSDPLVHVTQAGFLAALERALAELPYRQRACWLLKEVEGLGTTEVGEVLGLSPGAVRGQLHRARHTLMERMVRWQ